METLELLKKQYTEGLTTVNGQMSQLNQQLETLTKQKEQLIGAIYALDTLSSQLAANTAPAANVSAELSENKAV